MKKFRKAIALITVMLLALSLFAPLTHAAASPTLRLSSASATSGGICSVSLSLENNPGIVAARLSVIYDTNALTLKSSGDSGLLKGKIATPSPDILYWEDALATENNKSNGIAATLTFEVKSGATSGKYPVTVGYSAGDIYNADLTDVNFTVVSGYITVMSAECYHSETIWQVTTAPTETQDGIRSEICIDCGDIIKSEKIPATGNEAGVCGELIWNYNPTDFHLTIGGEGIFPDFTSSFLSQPWYEKKAKIKSIDIAVNTDRIGSYAFAKHTALQNITLPESLNIIGDYAFLDCLRLSEIQFPSSLQEIGNSAFSGCSSLTSLNFPSNLVSIGDKAFENCFGLDGVLRIEKAIYIGNYAFSGCNGLTGVVLPDDLGFIGDNAFANCDGLSGVLRLYNTRYVGNSAFANCDKLSGIVLPDTASFIGEGIFDSDKIYCRMGSAAAEQGYPIIADFDGNKTHTSADLVSLKKELINDSSYSILADINEDDAVDLLDLIRFKKQLAN